MFFIVNFKKVFVICVIMLFLTVSLVVYNVAAKKDYITWVDFDIKYEALNYAYNLDASSHNNDNEIKYNWIEILAYLGAKYGGDFSKYKQSDVDALIQRLNNYESMNEITKNMKHFSYYMEAYSSVLQEFVGYYTIEEPKEDGTVEWVQKYGLKAFSPIAKKYYYTSSDDFGMERSYGYKRKHLGHDLLSQTGTPVIAIESGIVEELGWNQYGGWRIGIRSFDKKRYYYYAHLRKDYPYASNVHLGNTVNAGDVIGYVGRTGYSPNENVNNIEISHLHLGLQLIFDESQKDGTNQIWVNLYELTKFLLKNKSEVQKIEGTKEYRRVYDFKED